MAWIAENWVWVLFIVGMIAMHLFGHGGHGGHAGHGGHGGNDEREDDTRPAEKEGGQGASAPRPGHHH